MSRPAHPAGGHWYVGKSRESLNCEQAPLERYLCQKPQRLRDRPGEAAEMNDGFAVSG